MSDPTISFSPKANPKVVSSKTREILSAILNAAGVQSCIITSTSRTPADQARIMFDNIIKLGVEAQKKLYAAAGDLVIDEFVEARSSGKGPDDIKAAMEAKILALGPGNVSHHCADPTVVNVIDISPGSVSNKAAFENAVNEAVKNNIVSRFFTPGNRDPAYHLEIPQ